MKNPTRTTIRNELEKFLQYRYVDVDESRLNELSAIILNLYTRMSNHGVTYKEAEAIISTAESMLSKVPIGRIYRME